MKPRTVVVTLELKDCVVSAKDIRRATGVQLFIPSRTDGNYYSPLDERPIINVIQLPKVKK